MTLQASTECGCFHAVYEGFLFLYQGTAAGASSMAQLLEKLWRSSSWMEQQRQSISLGWTLGALQGCRHGHNKTEDLERLLVRGVEAVGNLNTSWDWRSGQSSSGMVRLTALTLAQGLYRTSWFSNMLWSLRQNITRDSGISVSFPFGNMCMTCGTCVHLAVLRWVSFKVI
jgi:hypothetical protein